MIQEYKIFVPIQLLSLILEQDIELGHLSLLAMKLDYVRQVQDSEHQFENSGHNHYYSFSTGYTLKN